MPTSSTHHPTSPLGLSSHGRVERFAALHEILFASEATLWLRAHWRHDVISLNEFRHVSPLKCATAGTRRRVVARMERTGVLMRADGLDVLGVERTPAWAVDWSVVDIWAKLATAE